MLPNVDDGPTKDLLVANGWAEKPLAREELHDLLFDPAEAANVAGDPAYEADARRARASGWRRGCARRTTRCSTATWSRRRATEITDPDQISPSDVPIAHR